MKTNTWFNGKNYPNAGSSQRVSSSRRINPNSPPSNETVPDFKRQTDNIAVIDCEKRKLREDEYHSRVKITDLDIPTAAFFPDLDLDEGLLSSTESPNTLEMRPFKRQALSLDTENGISNDRINSETDSDHEIIHILSSVPRLKLSRRTMTSSNSKDTYPHIIPEEDKDNNEK